jgi:hypothetical protein
VLSTFHTLSTVAISDNGSFEDMRKINPVSGVVF